MKVLVFRVTSSCTNGHNKADLDNSSSYSSFSLGLGQLGLDHKKF